LLGYASADDPGLVERLFERRRRRRVEDARDRLAGKDFAGKVEELACILDEDGYLADFQAQPDGSFLVTEHNCAILGVARRYGQACSSEIGFLREALPEASIERIQHMIAGAHSCAYEVKPQKQKSRR
jgi:DeoR family transcriptional regulator, suf operon transcriptional repressor